MGLLEAGAAGKVSRIELELTTACDHRCVHCYNVWNADPGYPRGALPTAEYLAMVERLVGESGAQELVLTGGEPLLHPDALVIAARAAKLVPHVRLVTNGSHLGPDKARALAKAGVAAVQLTLLGSRRETHDRLKGVASFDDTLRAILDLKDAGVPVQICHVASRGNAGELPEILQLCFGLGVKLLVYNRMCPSGGAVARIGELLPTVEQVETDLEACERLGRRYGIAVATAMPIPPCLVRHERYPWVRFGFCSLGSASLVIDPLGNVRPCNLSSHVLGNVARGGLAQLRHAEWGRRFRRVTPKVCRGCVHEASCGGGCPASGVACRGSSAHPEPFLAQVLGEGR